MTALVVIAKEAVPGRVKTRLQPHLSLEEAAAVAAALIADTLASARTIRADRHILFFDGDTPPAGAGGFEILRQPEGTLDERLAWLFDHLDGPVVLVGMDTPQFGAAHLPGLFPEWPAGVDAVFGPAEDGGFWSLGMREPDGSLIRGVPMSRDDTGAVQLNRMLTAGRFVKILGTLADVDDYDSACRVADLVPSGAFASVMRRLGSRSEAAA